MDTLHAIAVCRGTTVSELVRVNAIYDADYIQAGWNLQVPAENHCTGMQRTFATARPNSRPAQRNSTGAKSRAAVQQARMDEAAERLIARARRHYDEADFEAALREAEAATTALARVPRGRATDSQRARGHLLAAMAAAGLEDPERARAEMARAVALDPATRLAPEDRSPRLVELLEAPSARVSVGNAAGGL
jgi:hypothetical protein